MNSEILFASSTGSLICLSSGVTEHFDQVVLVNGKVYLFLFSTITIKPDLLS